MISKKYDIDPQEEEVFVKYLNTTTISPVKNGEIVTGTVISIGEEDVTVDVGMKQTGIISFKTLLKGKSEQDVHQIINVGDRIEAVVCRVNDVEGHVFLALPPQKE